MAKKKAKQLRRVKSPRTSNTSQAKPPAIPTIPKDDLSVRVVVLFSSGVGYFEHAGAVTDEVVRELRFKSEQVNDLLKSLVLSDPAGKIGTIVYPSQDPTSKTLKSFQVDITENPSLASLLGQLRGAKLTTILATEKISGVILGVEQRKRPVPESKSVIEAWILNLLSNDAIRSIALDDITSLTLDEPQLQQELTRALSTLAQARDQEKKTVSIRFLGQGNREVRLGYVVQTPVWKTSYRLIIPAEANGTSWLQGWAIVENQSDNDWAGVKLSLVSGRPISFVQELYQPIYINRPVVQPELYQSLTPQVDHGGLEMARVASPGAVASAAPMMKMRARAARGGAGGYEPPDDSLGLMEEIADDKSVSSAATTERIGELFQYTVADVSLPRQRSAMIPIVTEEISVERVSLYNQQTLARHPLNGARVTNSAGKHLLQGPMTVLESGSYAGDARLDDLPPGQSRLITFGIDLQVVVDAPPAKGQSTIRAIRFAQKGKGQIEIQQRYTETQTYQIDNKSDRDKTVIIEHPRQPRYTLYDTPAPLETTASHHRFRVEVSASQSTRFVVQSEFIGAKIIDVDKVNQSVLGFYISSGQLPDDVRATLTRAIDLQTAMTKTLADINTREAQIKSITQEQSRMRENIKTAPDKSAYQTRLLNKLNEQETRIEQLQLEIETLSETRDRQQGEWQTFLGTLRGE